MFRRVMSGFLMTRRILEAGFFWGGFFDTDPEVKAVVGHGSKKRNGGSLR